MGVRGIFPIRLRNRPHENIEKDNCTMNIRNISFNKPASVFLFGVAILVCCLCFVRIRYISPKIDSEGKESLQSALSIPGTHLDLVVEHLWEQHNAIAAKYDTRMRFFGKVVDQNGVPLEGVKIVASVTTLRMIKTERGYQEYETLEETTGSEGIFIFDGSEGMYLDIDAIEKPGYVLPSAYQFGMSCVIGSKIRYRYSSIGDQDKVFKPNPSSPEVFHLWKLNKPEPLELGGNSPGRNGPEFKVGAPPDPLRTISIMVSDIGTSHAPQWEVTVSALEAEGGVIIAGPSDIFMFKAPETGYAHSIKFRYGLEGADESQDDPGASLRFYVRSHSSRWHSACEFSFFSPNRKGIVETKMRFWLNPNGSRNLEHDGGRPLHATILK